jgi:ribonuclease T1
VRKLIRLALLLIAALVALEWWSPGNAPGTPVETPIPDGVTPDAAPSPGYPAFLPPEAIATLERIERGGPFPYERDGTVFQNRERRLPAQPRGYYREYTVPTPGSRDRGARRIVSGGDPPEVFYYTDDHYRSFREVEMQR